jgi:hypothetical protein
MEISAAEFYDMYVPTLERFDGLCEPKYHPALRRLYTVNPRSLIDPGKVFANRTAVQVFVAQLVKKTYEETK